jgi:endoglucanase
MNPVPRNHYLAALVAGALLWMAPASAQTAPQATDLPAAAATDLNYADAFMKSILFYEASWCGPDANNNRLKWRGPCHVNDGADVGHDLTGGFHDAGDHVKFGLPQAYASSTLAWGLYEFNETYQAKGQAAPMLNVLRHFTDYYLKCMVDDSTFYYQIGEGNIDHAYWGPPELQKDARPSQYAATPASPASDVCGDTAATLAIMSMLTETSDPAYSAKCLSAAAKLFTFGKTHLGQSQSGGFYSPGSYLDELTWGAYWLYKATGTASYKTDIEGFVAAKGITGGNGYANHWTHCWDDVWGGVFVKLATEFPDQPIYKQIAEENITYWMNSLATTAGGLKYINSWGNNRYVAAECMLALVYYKNMTTPDASFRDFAKSQIDYILGKNPMNMSYEVGFGSKYPLFPHHRAASGRYEPLEAKTLPEKHLIYGALVGGPDDNDVYVDSIDDYAKSEVAIDYNAGFVGALAGITTYFGQDQLPGAIPGIEGTGPFLYTKASIIQEQIHQSTIDVWLVNNSLLPPAYNKNLSFRYFVNLSELYSQGLSVNDVSVFLDYSSRPNRYEETKATISGLKPWDEANHIYYFEGSWPSIELYGAVEFKFRLAAYMANLDTSNDYSHEGLGAVLITTPAIPVYENGKLVFGTEPAIAPPPASVTSLSVQSFNGNRADSSSNLSLNIKVINTGNQDVDLQTVVLHYYFTKDADIAQQINVDYADGKPAGSQLEMTPLIDAKIAPLGVAKTNADTEVLIGFKAGAPLLKPGGYVQIQARVNRTDWSNFLQTNDYSFNATSSAYGDWEKVTAYAGTNLLWGIEP